MHDDILLLPKGIRRILQSQFNPSDPGKGMEKLLDTIDNRLTLVKSTDAITAGSVIKKAKQNAEVLLILTGKTILPIITTQAEAQEEADRLNVINQLVIGAKEGAVEAIMKNLLAVERPLDTSNSKQRGPVIFFPPIIIQICLNGKMPPMNYPVQCAAFKAFFARQSTLILICSFSVQSCHFFVLSA
jgi:hypothetical protein